MKNDLFIKEKLFASSLVYFLHLPLTCSLVAHYPFDYPFETDNIIKYNRKRIRLDKNPIRSGIRRIPDSPKCYSSYT